MKLTEAEDAGKEVVTEEAVTKDVADNVDNSTAPHTHHQPETTRDNWTLLVQS